MPAYLRQSLEKAQHAVEIADQLFDICLSHASTEDPDLLIRAGSLVGDFSNNLRSALNYTTRAIVEREVVPKLSASERKKLIRGIDFPWALTAKEFDAKPLPRILKEAASPLYKRIRRFQPFHSGDEWLGHLMTLSNRDKHVIINNVLTATATAFLAFLPDGTQLKEPHFVGGKLVIFTKDGPQAAELPHYYGPLRAFATPRKTWSLYLLPVVERFSLDLIDFTRTTPIRVVHVLAAMEAVYDDSLSQPD